MAAAPAKLNVFSYINEINTGKSDLFSSEDQSESIYNKYLVELMLSQHADALMFVNELNQRPRMPKRWHFDYLRLSLSKRKRFGKLNKPLKEDNIETIKDYYGYSTEKALSVMDLIDDSEIERMKSSMFTGGLEGKSKKNK